MNFARSKSRYLRIKTMNDLPTTNRNRSVNNQI